MAVKRIRKKEKLSKEESLYRSAASLMEAVDCVDRFERAVSSLNDAANKFEKLGSYKDSKERMEKCMTEAQEAADRGSAEAFGIAVSELGKARTKSSFNDAIEDFKRARRFGYKKEECDQNIKVCQKEIKRLETIAMFKRWCIFLCVLAFLAVCFINTPFYPLVQGMYYQSKGELNTAIDCYIKSGGVLNGNGNMKECYYIIAEGFMAEGSYDKALASYKSARDKFDAQAKAFRLEKEFIADALPGSTVKYGNTEWLVLDKTGSQALLFGKSIPAKIKFDDKGSNNWLDSSIRRWLNTKYIKEFSKDEKSAMAEQGEIITASRGEKDKKKKKDKECIFLLDKLKYEKYKDIIGNTDTNYWLKDSGTDAGNVCYVKEDASVGEAPSGKDNIKTRCSLWVKYN